MGAYLTEWPTKPAVITRPPTEKEIRAALDAALDGTLPHEGWEQPVEEVLTSLAAGLSARPTGLLWDDRDDDGPQSDWALSRWWIEARQMLADELTPVYLAHAAMPAAQALAPALRIRRRQ